MGRYERELIIYPHLSSYYDRSNNTCQELYTPEALPGACGYTGASSCMKSSFHLKASLTTSFDKPLYT